MDEGDDRAQFILAKKRTFGFSSIMRWFINVTLYLEIK